MSTRRFATQQQAADYFHVSDRTIRNWISEGHITGYRLPTGRAIRVDLDEIERVAKMIPTVQRAVHPFGPKARIKTVAVSVEDAPDADAILGAEVGEVAQR